jgi:hypothetical protein
VLLDTRTPSEREQLREGLVCETVLGIVDVEVTDLEVESRTSGGVCGEHLAQVHVGDLCLVRSQFPPLGRSFDRFGCIRHWGSWGSGE